MMWTKHDDFKLLFYKKAGKKSSEIAELLDRTASAIRSRLHQLDYVDPNPTANKRIQWTKAKREKLKEYWTSGLSISDIAKRMKLSESSIRNRVYREGLRRFVEYPDYRLTSEEAAYIAGFLDGEGSVYIRCEWKHGVPWVAKTVVEIANSQRKVLDWIEKRIVHSGKWQRTRKPKIRNDDRYCNQNVKMYYLAIHGEGRICTFLKQVLPYLQLKRKQAEAILEFHRTHPKGTTPLNRKEIEIVIRNREATASRKAPHRKSLKRLKDFLQDLDNGKVKLPKPRQHAWRTHRAMA